MGDSAGKRGEKVKRTERCERTARREVWRQTKIAAGLDF